MWWLGLVLGVGRLARLWAALLYTFAGGLAAGIRLPGASASTWAMPGCRGQLGLRRCSLCGCGGRSTLAGAAAALALVLLGATPA